MLLLKVTHTFTINVASAELSSLQVLYTQELVFFHHTPHNIYHLMLPVQYIITLYCKQCTLTPHSLCSLEPYK